MKSHVLLWFFIFTLQAMAQRVDFDHINFIKADATAQRYEGEELFMLPTLSRKLTQNLPTEAEKFRAIYLWVCQNISSDYGMLLKNEHKNRKLERDPKALKAWQKKFTHLTLTKLERRKETVCTGYAYLIKKMAQYAGLDCVIVNGFGLANNRKINTIKAPNHSWNAIKLDGKWYLCDATWAAGYTDLTDFTFRFDYDDSYFLMEPALFAQTHIPLEEKWFLHIPQQAD